MSSSGEKPGFLGKYGSDRTSDIAIPKTTQLEKLSLFMLTINPNEVTYPGDPDHENIKERLAAVGNFLLEERSIRSILMFPGSEAPRQADMDKVLGFVHHRYSLEYGTQIKRLHMHLVFGVKHRTKVLLNKDDILEIAKPFFRNPKKLHLNIRGTSGNNQILDYLEKYPLRKQVYEAKGEIVQDE